MKITKEERLLSSVDKTWKDVKIITDLRKLGKTEVDDIIYFEDILYWVNEIHKSSEGIRVIIEDVERHNYRDIKFER